MIACTNRNAVMLTFRLYVGFLVIGMVAISQFIAEINGVRDDVPVDRECVIEVIEVVIMPEYKIRSGSPE